MSSAQSIFFYGVFIETAQLCFAADAYKKSKGSLLGIDLICARRRKGELSAASSQVKAIPVEVWRLIKLEVISNAMAQAEQSEITSLLADWEDDGDLEDEHLSSTWEDVGMPGLHRFYGDGGMSEMLDDRLEVNVSLFRPLPAALTLPFYDTTGDQRPPQSIRTRSSFPQTLQQSQVSFLRYSCSFRNQPPSSLNCTFSRPLLFP